MEKVSFISEGTACSGWLALPGGAAAERRPAIVLGHGFGALKESLIVEVKALAAAGYVALGIDYRSFGDSEGEPRGSLNPHNEVEDFRNAITYLQRRPDVDPERIGIWGISFGGGVALMTAALDQRVRAVVALVPVVNGRRWLQSLWGAERFERLRQIIARDRLDRYERGAGGWIPIIAPDRPAAITMDEAGWRQYMQIEAQPDRPTTQSGVDITIASLEKVMEWEPERFIEHISPRPMLIVTSAGWDMMHPYKHIQEAYARAGEPKRLTLLRCEQNEVYLPPWQGRVLAHATAWFDEHLSAA